MPEKQSDLKNGSCESSFMADFLLSQKLLDVTLLQKKSIMQVLAANILMRISIYCENCPPVFSAMTGTPAQDFFMTLNDQFAGFFIFSK